MDGTHFFGLMAEQIVGKAKVTKFASGLTAVVFEKDETDYLIEKSVEKIHGTTTGGYLLSISPVNATTTQSTAYITIDDKSLEKLDGLLKDAESKLDYSKIK